MLSTPELSLRFFLQLACILAACRGAGWVARRLGQPLAVGEMIAGILLGPSLFGLFLPDLQAWIFPKQSMPFLYIISQVSLSLYMFLVGAEFRSDLFRQKFRSALSISLAGMLAPFVLGGALGAWLSGWDGLFGANVTPFHAVMFLGASMSITAFPMLARIIQERGLTGTTIGTLALAAGAIDDAAAWCLLAVVLGSYGGNWQIAFHAVAGGILYSAIVLIWGRRWFSFLGREVEKEGRMTPHVLATALLLAMLGSWITDGVGIHAVLGAFIMGVAMPRGLFSRELRAHMESFVMVFLVPLFFAYSGLNTRIDLVNTPALWALALLVFLVACLGKGGACWAAARLHGENPRRALGIGTLMNARGLMELVILNIGLQQGIIGPTLFSLMVIMAVGTTLMATPVFERVHGRHAPREGAGDSAAARD